MLSGGSGRSPDHGHRPDAPRGLKPQDRSGGLPASELAIGGPEGSESDYDGQQGRNCPQPAGGSVGGPVQAGGDTPPDQPGDDIGRAGQGHAQQGGARRGDG